MTGFCKQFLGVFILHWAMRKHQNVLRKKLSDKKRFIIGNINSLCGVARQKQWLAITTQTRDDYSLYYNGGTKTGEK